MLNRNKLCILSLVGSVAFHSSCAEPCCAMQGMTPLQVANGSAAQVIVLLGGCIHVEAPAEAGVVARAPTAIRNLGYWLQRIFWRL